MMMPFHSCRSFWHGPLAAAVVLALAGGASLALGQSTDTSPQAPPQGAPLTLLLRGPTGDASTLDYSAQDGWRLHAGWDVVAQAGQGGGSPQLMTTALKPPTRSPDLQPTLERPLTVFIDGPTGFTFIYVFDEGWKFVGQIANAGR